MRRRRTHKGHAAEARRRSVPPKSEAAAGGGYPGVGAHDDYGNPIRRKGTVNIVTEGGRKNRKVFGGKRGPKTTTGDSGYQLDARGRRIS